MTPDRWSQSKGFRIILSKDRKVTTVLFRDLQGVQYHD